MTAADRRRTALLRLPVLATLGLLVLTGCQDEKPDSDPDRSSAGAPCNVVTDAEITAAAGRTMRVEGPENLGALAECTAVPDSDAEPLRVTWTLEEASEPLRTTVGFEVGTWGEAAYVEVGDGIEAALTSAEISGTPVGRAMAVLDEQLVVVEASLMGLDKDESDLTLADLTDVAVEVVERYATGG